MNEIAVDWFNEHFDDPKIAMTLKEKYFNDCDLGDVSLDEVFESIGKDLGYDPKELKDDWYRRIHLRQDVFDYITSLRRGDDKLVLLSNAGFPFMGEIIDRFGFKDRFDKIRDILAVSNEAKNKKLREYVTNVSAEPNELIIKPFTLFVDILEQIFRNRIDFPEKKWYENQHFLQQVYQLPHQVMFG